MTLNQQKDCSLLIVDNDGPFRNRLERAMQHRGFDVTTAESCETGISAATDRPPAYAVIDLRLGDGSGLDVVEVIHRQRPDAHVVMLTGYGNITTAVAAVKAGAIDYLSKPADADDIEKALLVQSNKKPDPPENPMSADRVRW